MSNTTTTVPSQPPLAERIHEFSHYLDSNPPVVETSAAMEELKHLVRILSMAVPNSSAYNAAMHRANAFLEANPTPPVQLVLPTPERVMHTVMKFQDEDRKNVTGTTNWAANLGMAVVDSIRTMNPTLYTTSR